jgi:NitT/TauT family transport system ATP-binding protein
MTEPTTSEPKGAALPGLRSDGGATREGSAGEGGMGRRAGPGGERVPLISVRDLSKSFTGPDGRPVPVLEGISLDVDEGSFVALLGRSGSGKSTLLRCIAGLIAPTAGEVLFRGQPLTGTNRETTMVFQTFALLPWLTVQENVELGLEARGVAPAQRSERALRAIDLVGLDGYETAYPKELSGGMRQRVGFARALVVEPAALLMDEPFSALDVLTSENLRGELLELWEGQRFPTKTMVMVTHNIEEAVLLADRILILGTNPGRIRADMVNPLARPRKRRTPDFDALVDEIYRMMTHREAAIPAPSAAHRSPDSPSHTPLPQATVDGLSGLAEILVSRHDGAADLADLAEGLGLSVDDLLPLVDALVLLGFAELRDDRLELTSAGRVFAGASIQDSKEIFARASLERAPLVRTIVLALAKSADGTLPAGFFTDVLRATMGEEEASRQLSLAVNWGRYAELYAYDADDDEITREDSGIGATLDVLADPAKRGALHLYLGAAPGSGKTFTMLREGRVLRERGEDVVIGFVQTHGRPRTEEAIGGLEVVPRGGSDDMDVDAVLARHPAVVLVDDYRRHADAINVLLDAGIEVISTVDVSDLDRAAAITGRPASETLPATALAEADDVRFVDNSPEALRKRLSHGNIGTVSEDLFSPANLAALREIGLRVVSETLSGSVVSARHEPPHVLVAVTSAAPAASTVSGVSGGSGDSGGSGVSAAEVISRGVRLARPSGATCTVLVLGSDEDGAIRTAAREAGAEVIVRSGDDAATISHAVHEAHARHLVLAGTDPGFLVRWRPTLAERLARELPQVHLHIVTAGSSPAGDAEVPARPPASGPRRGNVRVYLAYAPGTGATTAMLEEAARRRARGSDVVVATVDPRPRETVTAALEGLDRITGGVDEVLARDPEVVAIDDLAAPGPDDQPRLAAARRVAEAGINVIATVRMGSMRDGTLDEGAVLAFADELEMVDAPPAELADRVRRGELVPADDIPDALNGDYSPEVLAGLREEAFGIVTEHADRKLATYQQGPASVDPVILTWVEGRPGQESLIRRAAALIAKVAGVFLVATPGPSPEYAALTTQLGGQFTALPRGGAAAVTGFARERGVSEILVAHDSRIGQLIRLASGIEIHLLPSDWSS